MKKVKENWQFLYWDEPEFKKETKSNTKQNDKNSNSTNREKSSNKK